MEYLRNIEFVIEEPSSKDPSVAKLHFALPGFTSQRVVNKLLDTTAPEQPYDYAGRHTGMAPFEAWALMRDVEKPIQPHIPAISEQITAAIEHVRQVDHGSENA